MIQFIFISLCLTMSNFLFGMTKTFRLFQQYKKVRQQDNASQNQSHKARLEKDLASKKEKLEEAHRKASQAQLKLVVAARNYDRAHCALMCSNQDSFDSE